MRAKHRIQLTFVAVAIPTLGIVVAIACSQGSGGGRPPSDGGVDLDAQAGVDDDDGAADSALPDAASDAEPMEAGGADGPPPRVTIEPSAACQGSGVFPDQSGACSVLQSLPYTDIGVAGFSDGGLATCTNLDSTIAGGVSVSMTIDQIVFYPWSDPNYIDAIYYGHSTSTGGDCGIRLSLLAYKVKAFLKVGDQIQLNKRLVRGSNDNDGTDTVSIYSSDGALLLARVTAGRPGRIEADILKGLTMAVQNNLCGDGNKTMLRVLFTDGASGQCALDAMTQRCCAMWNATYAVRLQDAFTSPPGTMGPPSPFISFEIARTDFWQAAQ